MRDTTKLLTLAVLLASLAGGAAASQSAGGGPGSTRQDVDEGLHLDATLMNVYVRVLDPDGRAVTGLRRDDFRLFENGVEREVAHFSSVDQPFTAVLALDVNGPMRARLAEVQEAVAAFVAGLRPGDRAMIVSLGDDARILADATSDAAALKATVRALKPGSGARLYAAVSALLAGRLRSVPGRKALILFTDGIDRRSAGASYEDTVLAVERGDTLVYPLVYDSVDLSSPKAASNAITRYEVAAADAYTRDLARKSGARVLRVGRSLEPRDAFAAVADELHEQYSLGYYLDVPPAPGERRAVTVGLRSQGLRAVTRDSELSSDARDRSSSSATIPEERRRWEQIPPQYFGRRAEPGLRLCGPYALPFVSGELRMRLATFVLRQSKLGDVISLLLAVDTSSLEAARRMPLEVFAAAFDETGSAAGAVAAAADVRDGGEVTLRLDVPIRRSQGGFTSVPYWYIVHQVRVVVRDAAMRQYGYASQFVSVTTNDRTLDLSGVMASPDPALSVAELTAASDGAGLGPVVTRRFRRGETLYYSFVASHAFPFTYEGRKSLAVWVEVERSGSPSRSLPVELVDVGAQRDRNRIVVRGSVPLGPDMSPGWYVLRIAVTDRRPRGGALVPKAVQWTDFEVTP